MPAPESQCSFDLLPDPVVPLPETVADCRGPGICPVLRCRYNVLINISRSTNVETITVGGCGGEGNGASLPIRRNSQGIVRMEDLDAVVDAAVELADKLPSTCLLDYIEDPELVGSIEDRDISVRAHMSLAQTAHVLGLTRERVRQIEGDALSRLRRSRITVDL